MKIGYVRVSTKSQDPYMQKIALENYGCEKIFLDNGFSGTDKKRPQYIKMKEMVREGDEVVVWKIDRLSRSLKELISDVEFFNQKNVQFVSITDNIDTKTPTGRFFFYINSIFAQMEKEFISERTREGLKAAKSKGKKLGRKPMEENDEIKHKMYIAYMLKTKEKKTINEICSTLSISRSTYNRYYKKAKEKQERKK